MDSKLDIKEEPVWREDHFESVTVASLPETDPEEVLDVKFKEEVKAEVLLPKVEEEEEESQSSSIQNLKEAARSEERDISRVLVKDIHPFVVESEVTNSPENGAINEARELRKSFVYNEDLQKLMSAHNQVMWCCHFCGKSFEYEPLLREHMIDHNRKKEPSRLIEPGVDSPAVSNERRLYCCDHCGKSSFHHDDIIDHIKNHEKVKPYKCKICLRAYLHRSNLQRHLQSCHKERRYSCSICSRTFTRLDSSRKHELRHKGVCRLVCPVCNKSFVEEGKFNEHKLKHGEQRRYNCLVCRKSYTTLGSLKRHQEVRSDNRNPCSSKVRGKSFGQLRRVHTRKHTVVKHYSCSICDKKFAQSIDMESHVLSHSK